MEELPARLRLWCFLRTVAFLWLFVTPIEKNILARLKLLMKMIWDLW